MQALLAPQFYRKVKLGFLYWNYESCMTTSWTCKGLIGASLRRRDVTSLSIMSLNYYYYMVWYVPYVFATKWSFRQKVLTIISFLSVALRGPLVIGLYIFGITIFFRYIFYFCRGAQIFLVRHYCLYQGSMYNYYLKARVLYQR